MDIFIVIVRIDNIGAWIDAIFNTELEVKNHITASVMKGIYHYNEVDIEHYRLNSKKEWKEV